MSFEDFVHKCEALKDASAGSLIYFLYGHFFQQKDLYKGIISFFIGTLFAIYVSPQVVIWTHFNTNFISFVLGLLGMKLTESILQQNYKKILEKKLNS